MQMYINWTLSTSFYSLKNIHVSKKIGNFYMQFN